MRDPKQARVGEPMLHLVVDVRRMEPTAWVRPDPLVDSRKVGSQAVEAKANDRVEVGLKRPASGRQMHESGHPPRSLTILRGWSRPCHLDIPPLIYVGRNASPPLTEGQEAAVDGRKPATDQHHADEVLRLQSLAQHCCPQYDG